MTDDLVQRLRGDWPEILVEKHWMMDSDAIDKQREEAANRIEQLEREKAVVYDLWEQQKEIALGYLTDCNKASDRIEALRLAVVHYDAALKSSWPYGAKGDAWEHWNEARIILQEAGETFTHPDNV